MYSGARTHAAKEAEAIALQQLLRFSLGSTAHVRNAPRRTLRMEAMHAIGAAPRVSRTAGAVCSDAVQTLDLRVPFAPAALLADPAEAAHVVRCVHGWGERPDAAAEPPEVPHCAGNKLNECCGPADGVDDTAAPLA